MAIVPKTPLSTGNVDLYQGQQRINTPAAAFTGNAQALGAVGQAIGQAGQDMQAIYEFNAQRAAKEADLALSKDLMLYQEEYLRLDGKDAVDGFAAYEQGLDDLIKKRREGLDPYSQQLYDNAAAQRMIGARRSAGAHKIAQDKKYTAQLYTARAQGALEDGASAWDDKLQVDAHRASGISEIIDLLTYTGRNDAGIGREAIIADPNKMNDGVAKQQVMEYLSQYHLGVISMALAGNSLQYAKTYFAEHKDEIDAQTEANIAKTLAASNDAIAVEGTVDLVMQGYKSGAYGEGEALEKLDALLDGKAGKEANSLLKMKIENHNLRRDEEAWKRQKDIKQYIREGNSLVTVDPQLFAGMSERERDLLFKQIEEGDVKVSDESVVKNLEYLYLMEPQRFMGVMFGGDSDQALLLRSSLTPDDVDRFMEMKQKLKANAYEWNESTWPGAKEALDAAGIEDKAKRAEIMVEFNSIARARAEAGVTLDPVQQTELARTIMYDVLRDSTTRGRKFWRWDGKRILNQNLKVTDIPAHRMPDVIGVLDGMGLQHTEENLLYAFKEIEREEERRAGQKATDEYLKSLGTSKPASKPSSVADVFGE